MSLGGCSGETGAIDRHDWGDRLRGAGFLVSREPSCPRHSGALRLLPRCPLQLQLPFSFPRPNGFGIAAVMLAKRERTDLYLRFYDAFEVGQSARELGLPCSEGGFGTMFV